MVPSFIVAVDMIAGGSSGQLWALRYAGRWAAFFMRQWDAGKIPWLLLPAVKYVPARFKKNLIHFSKVRSEIRSS
eukprot:scaffold954_cov72-Skeletonema_dohrnii-CCMP3373.AAC.2